MQTNTQYATHSSSEANLQTINWSALYKVYVNLETTLPSLRFNLEVIDGYLKPGEHLVWDGKRKVIENTEIFGFDIKTGVTSTYIQISELELTLDKSVLVIIKREGEITGYQWLTIDGGSLGEPFFFH